ncbi:hypothetical protein FSP39_021974 [Pinctada imbricata]|uniref:Protein VAC14 homolog n=1 Tax=Pinctada imbricata TaxID=66713 RepID=A0AA89BTG1_PINIB|nr:hypothetical protein FSP39_021974 [Pinctada imbricata]
MISVSDAAKMLNTSLKNLIGDDDDLPSPLLNGPRLGEGEESENTKQPQNEGIQENITETSDTRASAIQLNVAEVIVVICNILSRGDFGTKVAALEWLSHLLMKVPHKVNGYNVIYSVEETGTKMAALEWLSHLLMNVPHKSFCHVEKFFPVLLNTLSDESEEVVLLDLEVLAEISSNPAGQFVTEEMTQSLSENAQEKTTIARTKSYVGLNVYFSKFMSRLLGLFKKDRQLLEPDERGYFIIRQLCQLLNAEDIFQSFSKITVEEQDVGFACKMVQTLNTILLTSTELFDLRNQLKNLSTQSVLKGRDTTFKELLILTGQKAIHCKYDVIIGLKVGARASFFSVFGTDESLIEQDQVNKAYAQSN